MEAAVSSAYAQLLSLGVVWVSLHCSGMCGPLVLGLGVGRAPAGRRDAFALLQVMAYQLGKAVIYAALGALAGVLGRSVAHGLAHAGPWISAALGLGLLAATAWHELSPRAAAPPRLVTWVGRALRAFETRFTHPLARSAALGVVMAALPCMLVGWVLALAASTRSPMHGAALMLLLVAMNSVPLLGVVRLASLVRARAPGLLRLQPLLGAVSGVWLLLVSAAAAGLLPHASLPLQFGARGFVVMFW